MLHILLKELPPTLRGPQDPAYKGMVPKRARFLHPEMWDAMQVLPLDKLVFTDIYRSAEASMAARSTKRGVQRPGYSAHNFGLAFDLDVDASLKNLGMKYPDLLVLLADAGLYCHRRDGERGHEDWHWNFVGFDPAPYLQKASRQLSFSWSAPVEARIDEMYGHGFSLSPAEAQEALAKLGMYHGEIDGVLGPISRAAITVFQKAWSLSPDGILGAQTQRTLAFVTAVKVLT